MDLCVPPKECFVFAPSLLWLLLSWFSLCTAFLCPRVECDSSSPCISLFLFFFFFSDKRMIALSSEIFAIGRAMYSLLAVLYQDHHCLWHIHFLPFSQYYQFPQAELWSFLSLWCVFPSQYNFCIAAQDLGPGTGACFFWNCTCSVTRRLCRGRRVSSWHVLSSELPP